MKKRIVTVFLLICALLSLSACSIDGFPRLSSKSNSTFSVLFIDVGQGDSALVECDGQYMLIDGGDKSHSDRVRSVLVDNEIQHLNILAISHFHNDHIGGLIKVLEYTTKIDKTIANSDTDEKEQDEVDTGEKSIFNDLEHQLYTNGSRITVPRIGDTFPLGSAEVEVLDVSANENNDSLVLLITYQDTRFLFTGDIEAKAQQRLTEKLRSDKRASDGIFKIDLIKMPHHGAYNDKYDFPDSNLNGLFNAIKLPTSPIYAVISAGNIKHPHPETIELLNQAEATVYITKECGDITVRSDGKTLSFETSR